VAAGETGGIRDQMLVPVTGLCLLVATTAFLVVYSLLGQIGVALHASRSTLSWVAIAGVLAATVSTGLLPALGSMLGQRTVMVVALGCLAAGSVITAAAASVGVVIAGRVVASLGLAAGTLSLAVVREHRTGRRLARGLAFLAAVQGVAAGVGFVLAGLVEEAAGADWRSVFLAIAVISALAAATAAVAVPGGRTRTVRAPDAPGALLLAAALVALLLPVTEGGTWGWTSPAVIGLLAAAALLFAGWVAIELLSADPLVRLPALARPPVAAGAVMFLVVSGTVGVLNITVPVFTQTPAAAGYGFGVSVLTSGLWLLPFAAAITASAALTGRLTRRLPARGCAAGSLGVEAAAMVLLAGFHHSAAAVILLVALFGVGHGGAMTSMFIMITEPVRTDEAGGVVSMGGAISGVGGAVATAVVTPILVATMVTVRGSLFPASSGYTHAWLFAAALAAAGLLVVTLIARPSQPPAS
jgi:MFS family permease